jgi:hypothetical protein
MRSRWHIENTAFRQWGSYWNLEHVYRHTPEALHALFLISMLAFNLLQLFFYCRLNQLACSTRSGTDTTAAEPETICKRRHFFMTLREQWNVMQSSASCSTAPRTPLYTFGAVTPSRLSDESPTAGVFYV